MNFKRCMPLGKAVGLGIALAPRIGGRSRMNSAWKPYAGHRPKPWSPTACHRHIRMARDCAVDFHGYLVASANLEPTVAIEVFVEINRNLDAAATQLRVMKTEHEGDANVLTAITLAENDLALSRQQQLRLGSSRERAGLELTKMAEGYSQIASQLDAVLLRLDEMNRRLEERNPATAR